MKDTSTKTPLAKKRPAGMKAEYDFTGGTRGKYVNEYRRGTNIVLIDAELSEAFPDSKSVNDALRALVAIAARTGRRKRN